MSFIDRIFSRSKKENENGIAWKSVPTSINDRMKHIPLHKVGDSVRYNTDSSGFGFTIGAIVITKEGVFYCEEYPYDPLLPQARVSRMKT